MTSLSSTNNVKGKKPGEADTFHGFIDGMFMSDHKGPRLYTINKVFRMTGVTRKTLRYYDEIGLLVPSARSRTGYRLYSDSDISKLQQILYFKELDMPLKEINQMINNPSFNGKKALQMQIEFLENMSNRYTKITQVAKNALNKFEDKTENKSDKRTTCPEKKKAIIVVDMQNDFVKGSLACNRANNIIPNIFKLLEIARNKGVYVIYANDCHIRGIHDELNLWGDHAIAGTTGIEIIEELKPKPEDFILFKHHYSSFMQTDLNTLLKELGVGTVIITGLHTHICILHTIADAYHLGYDIIVPEDCTDSFTQEDYEFGLRHLKECYNVEINNSMMMIEYLQKRV